MTNYNFILGSTEFNAVQKGDCTIITSVKDGSKIEQTIDFVFNVYNNKGLLLLKTKNIEEVLDKYTKLGIAIEKFLNGEV